MTQELPQCWAYNTTGKRCEQLAGHASRHSYTISWDDNECYNPVKELTPPPPPVLAAINSAVNAVAAVVETEQPAPKKCVACSHMHRGGECKCGCHEHIG